MAKNELGVGKTKRVTGLANTVRSGALVLYKGWPGVVVKDVVGNAQPEETVDGIPIAGQLGSGEGDLQVWGTFKFVDTDAPGMPLSDGHLVNRASPSGVTLAAGPGALNAGHVFNAGFDEGGVRFVEVKLLGQPNGGGLTLLT